VVDKECVVGRALYVFRDTVAVDRPEEKRA
jgi:hypothetical protein